MNYTIRKEEYPNYDLYYVTLKQNKQYCYYEKKGNVYVEKVYFIVGEETEDFSFWENSIYVFLKDVSEICELISIFNIEFSNLKYFFLLEDISLEGSIQSLCSNMGLEENIMTLEEYFHRIIPLKKKEVDKREYSNYDVLDNVYLEQDEDEMNNMDEDKNFANYNGYNERLIDSNVKNIVQVRKGNGGKNGL